MKKMCAQRKKVQKTLDLKRFWVQQIFWPNEILGHKYIGLKKIGVQKYWGQGDDYLDYEGGGGRFRVQNWAKLDYVISAHFHITIDILLRDAFKELSCKMDSGLRNLTRSQD